MYSRDVPEIVSYVEAAGAQGMLDVATFVALTIQNPLSNVLHQVEDVRIHGRDSKYLWGFKRKTYDVVAEDSQYLYDVWMNHRDEPEFLMEVALQVPGFGLAKAGFFLQCLGMDVGCFDRHNIEIYGISFKRPTKKNLAGDIEAYVKVCQEVGTEKLWDDWCEYVAGAKMNRKLPTADLVSREHVLCVIR